MPSNGEDDKRVKERCFVIDFGGKRWVSYGYGEKPREKSKKKVELGGGLSLFWAEPLSFYFFHRLCPARAQARPKNPA